MEKKKEMIWVSDFFRIAVKTSEQSRTVSQKLGQKTGIAWGVCLRFLMCIHLSWCWSEWANDSWGHAGLRFKAWHTLRNSGVIIVSATKTKLGLGDQMSRHSWASLKARHKMLIELKRTNEFFALILRLFIKDTRDEKDSSHERAEVHEWHESLRGVFLLLLPCRVIGVVHCKYIVSSFRYKGIIEGKERLLNSRRTKECFNYFSTLLFCQSTIVWLPQIV